MKISEVSKKIIVDEFSKILDLMNSTSNVNEKLFYFSATYGMVSRILNIDYDSLLILIHSVLTSTHASINSLLNSIANNSITFFSIPKNYFEMIEENLKEITLAIDKNNETKIYKALEKFSVLAYISIGNGNYLYKKGIIKF